MPGAKREPGRRTPRYPAVFELAAADAGQRVERCLLRRLKADPGHVARLLREQRVRFVAPGSAQEGRVLAAGEILEAAGAIHVAAAARADKAAPLPNRRIRLRVHHEDADLAVLCKPAGLSVHPGPGHGSDTLLNALVARYPELLALGRELGFGLVHRLDKETSGLMVVARTRAAQRALVRLFVERRVAKEYLALVERLPGAARKGTITTPVDGKEARTEYEVLEERGAIALVRARPLTGRTHQVRLHLARAGLPVLRDRRHGRGGSSELVRGLFLERLALHAHRLAFDHPLSGQRQEFEEPLPRDLRHAWQRARENRVGAAPRSRENDPSGVRERRGRSPAGGGATWRKRSSARS
ncbi:MAG: RluA family pseudouridine synthase [Planctomycetes bacterium]|nr:RluA family pseudouridine synthase [Planctomycetota bacterium]